MCCFYCLIAMLRDRNGDRNLYQQWSVSVWGVTRLATHTRAPLTVKRYAHLEPILSRLASMRLVGRIAAAAERAEARNA
jgi:hypothetical protein